MEQKEQLKQEFCPAVPPQFINHLFSLTDDEDRIRRVLSEIRDNPKLQESVWRQFGKCRATIVYREPVRIDCSHIRKISPRDGSRTSYSPPRPSGNQTSPATNSDLVWQEMKGGTMMALPKPEEALARWANSEEGERVLALQVRKIVDENPHYLNSSRYRVIARPFKSGYRFGWRVRIGWK